MLYSFAICPMIVRRGTRGNLKFTMSSCQQKCQNMIKGMIMIIKEWNQTRFYSIQNEFALTKNKTAPAGIKEQKGGVNKEHLVDISGSN